MFTLRSFIVFALGLIFVQATYGQDNFLYSALLIPQELKTNADDVTRLENKTLDIKSIKEAYLYHRQVVTILNKNSSNNLFYVSYDKSSKVKKIKARLFDANGNLIRKVDNDEIKDVSSVSDFSIYEDDRIKYLEITHNTYPYTVEFEYELQAKGVLLCYLPNWHIQGFGTSIQQASYQISLPQEIGIHQKVMNIDLEATKAIEGSNTNYTWTVENLPAKKREVYGPSPSSVLPQVLVSLDEFEIENYIGSMRSWKDFGHFMHELHKGRDQLSPAMQSEVKALTANANSTKEKIEILYNYLQENMRYVSVQLGIGGWQPFDAQYVEKNKYGDCKALTNFMKSMLKVADIEAYPVLIYSNPVPDHQVSEDFTSSKFNHVILNVPSENTWLECTSSDYPINYIGLSNANRNALMITETGGQLVKTPTMSASANVEHNNAIITLSGNGAAQIKNDIKLQGSKHEPYRGRAFYFSKEEFEKWFHSVSELPTFTIETLDYQASNSSPEFEINAVLQVNNYASKAGKRLFVPLNKINPFNRILKEYQSRQHPVVINTGYTEEDTIEFIFPEGYTLESTPQEVINVESEFGNYTLKMEKTTKGVLLKRSLTIKSSHQPAEKYDSLRAFFKEISKADNAKMVLVQKKT